MRNAVYSTTWRMLAVAAAAAAMTACEADMPTAATDVPAIPASGALGTKASGAPATNADLGMTLAELRRATARYHDVDAALADGFREGPGCETLNGNSNIGIPYPNLTNVSDGAIDPSKPDVLLYEPGDNGKRTLVGVGLAIPFALWTESEPPELFGVVFQREEGPGVYGLHVWVWRHNPLGTFAIGNPRVTCG